MTSYWTGTQAVASLGRPLQIVVARPPVAPVPPEPELDPDRVEMRVRVRSGGTFGELASEFDLPGDAVRQAALEHYDLAMIRPDRDVFLTWQDGDPVPLQVRYVVDEDLTVIVDREGADWSARVEQVVWTPTVGRRAFTIDRSLWQDGLDAGLRPSDLVRLAGIFEYELDFNTELRAGASFALVADVLQADARSDRLGDIHAVRLQNGGKTWIAVRHPGPDGKDRWYQPDGSSLQKPFLRSPLEFSRVTSGFNPKRFHPILKRARPHNGTDFGAPTGTPVRSVAEGKVVFAGPSGGHGRFVKVQHDNGYATSYSHLSSIHVKNGQRIGQGTVVGKVGASGLATGPHLHYQMWKNGRFVDAMGVDLPNQAPLPSSEKAAFQDRVETWVPRLDIRAGE